ncbi:AMP-binding protein [Desulfoluna sp.]|uniref:non-ribosomal peptide synthetase n=1 Tax=Desulfoluna sp. TaxID=2045199 RepID=UPI00260845D4|nr:AMP-binding protein [Desulfoluna sp.]
MNTFVETKEARTSLDYFTSIFHGLETDSNPIYDTPENIIKSTPSVESHLIALPGTRTPPSIKNFLMEKSLTESTFFLGVFSYVLAKFTGQNESVFCIHTKNTTHRILPIYIKIDETQLISEYLDTVHKNYLETIHHTACPFETLAEKLGIKSDIQFNYGSDSNALIPSSDPILSVFIFSEPDGYQITLHYRGDLYRKETIQRFSALFEKTVSSFLNTAKLSELTLISDEDRRLCQGFNQTEVPYDTSLTLVDLLGNQMKKTPDNIALVYKDVRISYKELDEVTERLAKHIKSFGIGRKNVVAILLPKSQYMTIAAIAVLKAGAAYQPLDPSYPMDRLKFMVQDADATLLIADESMIPLLPDYHGPIVLTKDIDGIKDSDRILDDPKPEDLTRRALHLRLHRGPQRGDAVASKYCCHVPVVPPLL